MKIADLINKLTEIKNQQRDIEVFVPIFDGEYTKELRSFDIDADIRIGELDMLGNTIIVIGLGVNDD